MRCLLLSADMSHADANMRSVYAHARFIVVTNVHRREFRSSLSVEEGLEPKWEQELLCFFFESVTNILKFRIFDAKQPELKDPACTGELSVETLKTAGNAFVKIPLYARDKQQIGHMSLEAFADSKLKTDEETEDSDHPHVYKNCVVCKDTHADAESGAWACKYCVCYRCGGTGKRSNGDECINIATAMTQLVSQ